MLSNVISISTYELNGYYNVLEEQSKQIASLQSYKACMDHMFTDQIYNFGWVKVWFHISKCVYSKIPVYEKEPFHEAVCEWFSVFEDKCPDCCKQLEDMREGWELFKHH